MFYHLVLLYRFHRILHTKGLYLNKDKCANEANIHQELLLGKLWFWLFSFWELCFLWVIYVEEWGEQFLECQKKMLDWGDRELGFESKVEHAKTTRDKCYKDLMVTMMITIYVFLLTIAFWFIWIQFSVRLIWADMGININIFHYFFFLIGINIFHYYI